ncbi:MAG: aminopeptidase N, partial [Gammaproteobacteria bacterium]
MTAQLLTTPLVNKKRSDYLPPTHTIETVDLTFNLEPDETKVTNVSTIKRV